MKQDFDFFIATMPGTRLADYYLGCVDSSVFIDFNLTSQKKIQLVRISFDGYGCCNLPKHSNLLNQEDSQIFIEELKKQPLDQAKLAVLVKKIIEINSGNIWSDALEEYGLIETIG
ncbi:MAG: hypothetical protein GQ574_18520 [Crocinitomix sp.]|nr:hypothetical protein [Crocinitomix sp.]